MSFGKGPGPRLGVRFASRFAAGFTVTAVATFTLAAMIGAATAAGLSENARLAIAAGTIAVTLGLDLFGMSHRTSCPISLRRQVPQQTARLQGQAAAALAWGLDAGTVFSTYRMSALSWCVLMLEVDGVAPWWAGAAYAAGFLVPLLFLFWLSRLLPRDEGNTAMSRLLVEHQDAQRAGCVAVLCLALAVTVSSA